MTLHMLQLQVRPAWLARFALDRRLPSEDEGYLLHRLLRDAFGKLAPQPFRFISTDGRRPGRLLGYSTEDAAALRGALAVAEPLLDAALPPAAILSKEMPGHFSSGQRFRFEVRACPIVRSTRADGQPGSRELDVFLHRCLREPDVVLSRDEVYRDWLIGQAAQAGVDFGAVGLHRLDQVPLVRRRHASGRTGQGGSPARRLQQQRNGRRIMARRPDVTFRGSLTVTDPERFMARLSRGLGRHRAFGYGMLLLSPAAG